LIPEEVIMAEIAQTLVLAVLVGIGAQIAAAWLRVPGIVCLLIFGIGLGRSGLGAIDPQQLGPALEAIVSLAVALILFEGGLSLELRDVGKVSGSLRNLVTIGTLVSFAGGGMAAHWLAEFPWPIALLYSSLVVVTGPTVIGPLLKNIQIDRQVSALLESEGVLIDPIGAILAVVVLEITIDGGGDPGTILLSMLWRLGLGSLIGGLGGWAIAAFLRRAPFLSDDLRNLTVLAGAWGLYSLSQQTASESGLMAVVVAGIVLGASELPETRTLRRFKGQLTLLAISVLFVLLAADLSLASVFTLGWGGLGAVLVLMLVVRPLNVWLCTAGSDLNWRQKLFAGWVAPKGIVSASVASLFAILLTQGGITGGESIKALVFLTIATTVTVQGLTAGFVADWLRLKSTERRGIAIAGATPVGLLVARLFADRGEAVVIVETDRDAGQRAEAAGFRVFSSSALDTSVLEAAGLESLGTFLAATSNGEVNSVLAQRVAEEFAPPRVLAAMPIEDTGNGNGAIASRGKVQVAFATQRSLKEWNQFVIDRSVKLGETVIRSTDFDLQHAHLTALICAGELIPLLIVRDDRLMVVSAGDDWLAGDQLIYLLHDPKPKILQSLAGSRKPELMIERLPAVEALSLAPSEVAPLPN
jgi:NhaP-type Na+/H+ or K+/H+ antiporter